MSVRSFARTALTGLVTDSGAPSPQGVIAHRVSAATGRFLGDVVVSIRF